jgi:hypothetical protein
LEIACFELNSRYRLYRRSPLEEAFPDKVLGNPIETTTKQPILPYKILKKPRTTFSLHRKSSATTRTTRSGPQTVKVP